MLDNGNLYWSELRPSEGGRTTTMCRKRRGGYGSTADGFSAEQRFTNMVAADFALTMANCGIATTSTNESTLLIPRGVRPVSPEGPYRYADLAVDRKRSRIVCVQEDHTSTGEPENRIVASHLMAT